MISFSWFIGLLPCNNGCRPSNSAKMHPSDQMSTSQSYVYSSPSSPLPSSHTGARGRGTNALPRTPSSSTAHGTCLALTQNRKLPSHNCCSRGCLTASSLDGGHELNAETLTLSVAETESTGCDPQIEASRQLSLKHPPDSN